MTRLTRTILAALAGALLVAAAACADGGVTAQERTDEDDSDLLLIRRDVELFAVLPEVARFAEGIPPNPASGDIYVGTFDVPSPANPDPKNKLLRFDRHGGLVASHDFGKTPLLGLGFDSANKQVYVANVGKFAGGESKIQRIAADLTGLTDVAIIPGIGAPDPRTIGNPDGSSDTITFGAGAPVPNAMVFDTKGNLYVSDSFQGAIFKITNPEGCAPHCDVETFSHDALLTTAGLPPFAANGLAFNTDESALFITNTGDDRVLKLDMVSGTKRSPSSPRASMGRTASPSTSEVGCGWRPTKPMKYWL